MRLRWNSASSRAKTLADEPQHCEQNADDGDGAENHCGMERCKKPCPFRRELRVIPGSLMRSDQAILDEDEDSVGDCIRGQHRNDGVPKTFHPSNYNPTKSCFAYFGFSAGRALDKTKT